MVDVTSMQISSHTPPVAGLSKSYKTRITQRGGEIAIGDSTGFYFADIVSNNAGAYSVNLSKELYLKDKSVNDFIEFKRDHFFAAMLEADFFVIIQRAASAGFFASSKITKIRSNNDQYLTMGMDLIPGPRLENAFIAVRDRRGI